MKINIFFLDIYKLFIKKKLIIINKQIKIIGSQFLIVVCLIVVDYQLYFVSDFFGKFDYRCCLLLFGLGCIWLVYDVMEVFIICDVDFECWGFVVFKQIMWLGNVGCCMVFKDYN